MILLNEGIVNSVDLNSLIERGRKIREDLRYVRPPEGVIRMFDVYALGDASEYHSWAATCVRFLYKVYPDDPCNRQFEEAMSNFENPKNHFNPEPLDKMIGIMDSCRTIEVQQESSGTDSLSARINEVELLRQQYEASLQDAVNSHKTIELYHQWYNAAMVLFAGEISRHDEYFCVFKEPDNSGNGYVLEDNYRSIQASYCVLLDMLKSGRYRRRMLETNNGAGGHCFLSVIRMKIPVLWTPWWNCSDISGSTEPTCSVAPWKATG